MTGRPLFASLLVVAVVSAAVVAEAEYNYASVAAVEETSARVERVGAVDGDLRVRLAIRNAMNERLRVQYVHLEANRTGYADEASTPFNGYRTLPPGRSSLSVAIPERQLSGDLRRGEEMTVSGYVSVEVYNAYRFRIPIAPTEVTL